MQEFGKHCTRLRRLSRYIPPLRPPLRPTSQIIPLPKSRKTPPSSSMKEVEAVPLQYITSVHDGQGKFVEAITYIHIKNLVRADAKPGNVIQGDDVGLIEFGSGFTKGWIDDVIWGRIQKNCGITKRKD